MSHPTRQLMKRILSAAITGSFVGCVPTAVSHYAHLVTEVREQHTQSLHPEMVTARDRGGHLVVSGQIGSDPGSPRASYGTVSVEVRDTRGQLVRESRECFAPDPLASRRGVMWPTRPITFDVDLGEGYEEPISLVVKVEPGACAK